MGWTCPQNGNISKCQKVSQMEPTRENKKKGRPKMTWKRRLEAELKDMGMNWGKAESLAKDRKAWRLKVAIFSSRRDADN